MTENSMKAVEYHKSGFSCSAAVLNAFRDEIFMDEIQALSAAAPMAGGRMIKCGAVLAAEYVIRNKYDGETAEICLPQPIPCMQRTERRRNGKGTSFMQGLCFGLCRNSRKAY